MLEFLDYMDLPFVQRMLIAGILAALACGVIGTYVVVKRNVFIAGGISHATFGGIGLAYYLQGLGWGWFDPILGAVIFAVGTAVILSLKFIRSRFREDSAIGVLWVLGMAAGVLFLNQAKEMGVTTRDPISILFGNILLISVSDLYIMGALLLFIYVSVTLFFKDLEALTFDEEFARISGIRVGLLNMFLLVLIALTVTLLIKVVGVVLIIAMLTIPAAIANLFTKRLRNMMLLASLLGVILTTLGNILSIEYDLSPGATIVILMGAAFLASLIIRSAYRRIRFGTGS